MTSNAANWSFEFIELPNHFPSSNVLLMKAN
jgi:hypothetical protein